VASRPSEEQRQGPFTPLRQRSFALLFTGQLASALGDQAFALALPWTVLAATGDVEQVALVLAAEAIPRVLLLPVGGVLADRINPRFVMALSDIGRAAVVGALGVTLLNGLPPLWLVALLAGLQGVGSGLFLPGSQAILPWTVKSKDIPAANGLMQIILWLTMVVGPVLGGIAVAAQAAIAFLLDAASFVVSAITLTGIRLSAPDTPATKAVSTVGEQTIHQSADTPEGADSTAHVATVAKPLLALATNPRLAVVQFVIEEFVIEEVTVEHSPPPEISAGDEPGAAQTNDVEALVIEGAVEVKISPPSDGLAAAIAPSERRAQLIASPPAVKTEPENARQRRSGVLSEIRAGVAYTFGQPLMRTAIVASTLGNLAYTGTFGVALILLSRTLDSNAVTLGLLLGACGVGGILGGLMAGLVGRSRHRGGLALLLWLFMPVALALVPIYAGTAAALPFSLDLSAINFGDVTLGDIHLGVLDFGSQIASLTDPERLLAIAILLGLTSGIIALGETIFITILQQRIPPELMARVFSVQLMSAGIAQPLSLIAVGFLSAAFGAGIAFFAAAALFFIAAIIGLSSRTLRRA
jgi:MFS family permease